MEQLVSGTPTTKSVHDPVARALLDYAPTGLLALDPERRILLANATARSVLGFDELTIPFSAEACIRLDKSEQTRLTLLLQGKYQGALRLKSRAGQTMVVTVRQEPDGNTLLSLTPAAGSGAERTSRDAMTGLADRQGFHDRLAALCGAAPGLGIAVLMIEIEPSEPADGSLDADAAVRLVAQRLRAIFRDADVVSRLGGAAFAVAMAALPEVPALAERLISVLTRPLSVERPAEIVGANVGIAFAPQHGNEPDVLTRAAGLALAHAKEDGPGVVRAFNDDLDIRTRTRHALAEDLRRAVPLQQLELYFQPQLSLRQRAVTGFEALVRWNHPRRGLLLPSEFIPLAEEMGLILPLGEWVLHEACHQAKRWPGHLTVAVNISPKQLFDGERLPRLIAATLTSARLPARRLEIEITERALARETQALAMLASIRRLGVRVSMDDFGTMSSSLSQLRRFPFDKLKIDRSFVGELGRNDDARAMLRAVAALGNGFGMTTVAEGVETKEQEALCRAEGYAEIQGYLISRPVPAGEVLALIARLSPA